MRTAREQEARSIRAEGAKRAQIIRAEADAEAARVYANSFGKDADFYEFNLYQNGSVELELTGVVNVQANVTLLDQEYRELASVSASKAGDPVVLTKALERGTYVARLRAQDSAQNNVRDKYSLRIRSK